MSRGWNMWLSERTETSQIEHLKIKAFAYHRQYDLLLLLLFTTIEFSFGGNSPYTSNK
jgi:hypothetical protein